MVVWAVKESERKKTGAQNVHNITIACLCMCASIQRWLMLSLLFYAFPVLLYKLLWISVLLLRNFYYSTHRPKHFIAQAPLTLSNRCPSGKTGEKVWKASEARATRMIANKAKKIRTTATATHKQKMIRWKACGVSVIQVHVHLQPIPMNCVAF